MRKNRLERFLIAISASPRGQSAGLRFVKARVFTLG
jgi:hypothetical protein